MANEFSEKKIMEGQLLNKSDSIKARVDKAGKQRYSFWFTLASGGQELEFSYSSNYKDSTQKLLDGLMTGKNYGVEYFENEGKDKEGNAKTYRNARKLALSAEQSILEPAPSGMPRQAFGNETAELDRAIKDAQEICKANGLETEESVHSAAAMLFIERMRQKRG